MDQDTLREVPGGWLPGGYPYFRGNYPPEISLEHWEGQEGFVSR